MKLVIHLPDYSIPEAVAVARMIDANGSGDECIFVAEDSDVPGLLTASRAGVWCDGCEGHAGPPGVRWPTVKGEDDSHSWVERCDLCCQYSSDEAAAKAVRESYAGSGAILSWGMSIPAGLNALYPHVEVG